MHRILDRITARVQLHPSPIEFEMAYQARIAIERIRFAIRHTESLTSPYKHVQDANMQLLDALDRLESVDRRFQIRSRISGGRNDTGAAGTK